MSGAYTIFAESYGAGGALTHNRFVKQSDDEEVVQASAAGERVLGVGNTDVTADEASAGKATAVHTLGVVWVEAGGNVARGAQVMTDNQGRAVTGTSTNTPAGIARKGGASGDLIPVFLTPGLPALA